MARSINTISSEYRDVGTRLPLSYEERVPILSSILLLLISGGLFYRFGTHVLENQIQLENLQLLITSDLIPLSIGLLTFALFWSNLLTIKIRIDDSQVRFEKSSRFFCAAKWMEPLTNYKGILTKEKRKKREKGGSYTIFSIRLVHKMDKHKFVDLYKSLSSIDYREKTESYAKLLNMPILTVTKDGYSKRMPAQLDTPLIHQTQNQIDAEKLQPIDLSKSTYIKVETLGNQPCLTISQKKAAWIGMVLCISFGIVAGLAWGDRNIVATIVASLMSLLGIYISIKSLLSKEVIVVSRDGVTTFTIFLGTKSQELHIPLQDIEEVKVAKHDRGNLAVQIISDRKIIDIGQHLPKEEKRQLATYIEQQIKQYGREG